MFTASVPHRAASRNCLFAENIRVGKFYDGLLRDERADLLMFINFPENATGENSLTLANFGTT